MSKKLIDEGKFNENNGEEGEDGRVYVLLL